MGLKSRQLKAMTFVCENVSSLQFKATPHKFKPCIHCFILGYDFSYFPQEMKGWWL